MIPPSREDWCRAAFAILLIAAVAWALGHLIPH